MRSRLTQAFLFVLGFWWLATAIYWSFCDPTRVNLATLKKVHEVFPWIAITIPKSINVLGAWTVQKEVLHYWTLPVIALTVLMTLIGAAAVWVWAWTRNKERDDRIKSLEGYRGVELSIGTLPTPTTPAIAPVALRATDEALKNLTPQQLELLQQLLGLLAANRDAFAGENQPAGSLLQQTLKTTYAALKDPQYPGCAALAAAAADIGKITAWKKDEGGAWIRVRNEQRESARLLAALPAWWALPPTERLAVLFAVKYRGQIDALPDTKDPAVYRLTRALLDRKVEAPASGTPAPTSVAAVEAAQAKAYEQRDPEVELYEVFEREVALLPFQTAGLPKNIPAVGWKRGNRAFFLENRLTESLMPKLRHELRAALAPTREKVRVEPLTAMLLKVFDEKGWLVKESGTTSVPANEALWVINAGKLEFSRVIILDLPEDILARLPPKDSYYEVVIKRPLFQAPIANSISKDDLMGGMLRPKKPVEKSSSASQE